MKRVIVLMEHTSRDGAPKILQKCTLPITGKAVVNMIISDLCVFEVKEGGGPVLTEIHSDASGRGDPREDSRALRGRAAQLKPASLFAHEEVIDVALLGAAAFPGSARGSADAPDADAATAAASIREEWKWRLEQFPGLEGSRAPPVADHLPKEDPATHETRLHHWQEVLQQDGAPSRVRSSRKRSRSTTTSSGPRSRTAIADEKFRDYEMPVNSDSAFWTDLGYTARRPFKTQVDYQNWIAQLRGVPRYFRRGNRKHEQQAWRASLRRRARRCWAATIDRDRCRGQGGGEPALHAVSRSDGRRPVGRAGEAESAKRRR